MSKAPGLRTSTFTTQESEFLPGTLNQGWYAQPDRGGDWGNDEANANYIVGYLDPGAPGIGPIEYRNFFTFDLSGLTGHVVCARLEVFSRVLSGQPVEELGLFDVSTPAKRLNANDGSNMAIFRDLGTGASYGRYNVDTTRDFQRLTLPLNHTAVHRLNRETGFFSIGGRVLSIDRLAAPEQYLFGEILDTPPIRLIVEATRQPG